MLVLKLRAYDNPDRPRIHPDDLPESEDALVTTLQEAKRVAMEWREAFGLGAGNWGNMRVVNPESGKTVAFISYNGRVWSPERDWRKRVVLI